MKELWKDIKGYEGLYQVSNLGRVKSLARHKTSRYNNEEIIMTNSLAKNYYQVALCKNGKVSRKRVNRLVAQAFIPNPNNLPYVNHKDENKLNNCVDNLEWCTPKYNSRYSSPKINQYDENYNLLKTWNSCIEIQETLNIDKGNIFKVCQGKRKTAGGYIWKYYDELEGGI